MAVFLRPAMVTVNDGADKVLSDHNRAPVEVTVERIESADRTASGKRKRYFIADKNTFTISWKELPDETARTVDGNLGFNALKTMYEGATGDVTLKLVDEDDVVRSYTCHITEFSYTYRYRWRQGYYYDCSLTLEEV